jgi:Zn-dependent protease with chaperone function
MNNIQTESLTVSMNSENTQISLAQPSMNIWKKLRGGFLLVLGYLLSPLCWWNDLLFNLPIAYFFGYLCSLLSPKLLFPCTILGYWLSNIIGILLMQYGSVDMFQQESKERNLKKELFNSLISSTAYTLVIVLLIQLKIIDTPIFFTNG